MTNPKSPLVDRYGQEAGHFQDGTGYSQLLPILSRGSCRSFKTDEVDANLVQLLCAAALASPTKSDLQQRDMPKGLGRVGGLLLVSWAGNCDQRGIKAVGRAQNAANISHDLRVV